MTVAAIQARLRRLGNKQKAKDLQWFFKTGPGGYGEGDRFLGVTVPPLRRLAKEYRDITLKETKQLLTSPIHEERLLALFILVAQFAKGDDAGRERIYRLYLKSTRYINNWDLVDASAGHIVGAHLRDKSRRPLYGLAKSKSLWERRIAIMATSHFIGHDEFADTLKLSRALLADEQDLIHKAAGWMLREVGKRDRRVAEQFLRTHYKKMPRTMLRYAIERFPEAQRQRYLKGTI